MERTKAIVKIGSSTIRTKTDVTYINNSANTIEKGVTLYYLIGLSFAALSMFFEFVGRTGLYYLMYEIIFWGIVTKKSKNRNIYTVMVLIFAVYEFILVFSRNACGIFPYYIYFF